MLEKISTPARGAIVGGVAVFAANLIVFFAYGFSGSNLLLVLAAASAGGILIAWGWLQTEEEKKRAETEKKKQEAKIGTGEDGSDTQGGPANPVEDPATDTGN